MGVVAGLVLGAGMVLIWLSFFPRAARPRPPRTHPLADLLTQAGWQGVSPAAFVALSASLGAVTLMAVWASTGGAVVALFFGAILAGAPYALVRARAQTRRTQLRDNWPDALDDLLSSVRAGLSLPEALAALAERGPAPMRQSFRAFALDYQVTGKFDYCLDRLKERMADPVADRVAEALRLTRDVGGTDLGVTLRALAAMLREEQRTRGELLARQSWTVNGARLAVVAPWIILAMVSLRADAAQAFNSAAGVMVLSAGAAMSAVAYWLMKRLGALPAERRVLR